MRDLYIYENAGRIYFLEPLGYTGETGKFVLNGADIYDNEGRRLGHWYVHNMPHSVINALRNFVITRSQKQRMMYSGKKRRTPNRKI